MTINLIRFATNASIYFLLFNFGSCLNDIQSSVHIKYNEGDSQTSNCMRFQFQCKNERQIGEHFFKCDNGACIDKVHKCDGIEQCCDGSDEWAQTCEKYSVERQKRATSDNCAAPPSSPGRTIEYKCDTNGTSESCFINGLIRETTVAKVKCNANYSAVYAAGDESICFRNKWYPDVRNCNNTQEGCEIHKDCQSSLICMEYKCVDPCPGICGSGAICNIFNHIPVCGCPAGYIGDPLIRCRPESLTNKLPIQNPCYPSPCGPNSDCSTVGRQAVCSCLPGYIGSPPNCRPECVVSSECTEVRACINQKCADPCPNTCGLNALCNVHNHAPQCSCPPQHTGDPFFKCSPIDTQKTPVEPFNPCHPNPCGVNTKCFNISGVADCQCIAGYSGDPFSGCKRECEMNKDCYTTLACIGYKCVDPCPLTCGSNATCNTFNHAAVCFCPSGYTGDPYDQCIPMASTQKLPSQDPCNPSPCGPYSQCRTVNHQIVCTCLPGYLVSPPNCRPECEFHSDCTRDRPCINQKCTDPCPNICGLNALCNLHNHIPECSCPPQHTGNPYTICSPIMSSTAATPTDAPPS